MLIAALLGVSRHRGILDRFRETRGMLRLSADDPNSYQGFMKQLARSGVGLLQEALVRLRPLMKRVAGTFWTVHGWVPIGVDGSLLDSPRTRDNQRALGTGGRAKGKPQLSVTVMTHLPTGLVWDWRQGPAATSERSQAVEMLLALPDGALLIGDAGFIGYEFAFRLVDHQQPFLLRCGGNVALLTGLSAGAIQRSRTGRRVTLWPEAMRRAGRPPLRLRLIVFGPAGRKVYLLTNVLSPSHLSKSVAMEMYRLRWGVEVTYRHVKQTLEHRTLRCNCVRNAQLELAGNILGLVVLVLTGWLVQGQAAHRLSVASLCRCMREALEGARWGILCPAFEAAVRQCLRDRYTRHGPKASRDYPRKKQEAPPGPPNLRPPTDLECRQMAAFDQGITKTG